jgi:hypothetical protein
MRTAVLLQHTQQPAAFMPYTSRGPFRGHCQHAIAEIMRQPQMVACASFAMQVVVIDEIGTLEECGAARTIAQRGGWAHT